MHALHYNTTVKSLVIRRRIWDLLELREFVRCLGGVNQSINKIVLQAHDFEPGFIEALTKILKSNRRIKTLEIRWHCETRLHEAGVLRLCDGMEYYHFEELVMSRVSFSDPYKVFLESLKDNQSVRLILIRGPKAPYALESICNALRANSTITEVTLEDCDLTAENCRTLNQILIANTIKVLRFGCVGFIGVLKLMAEGLQMNTSVQELEFQNCKKMDWKLFGETVANNKAVKRLNLNNNDIDHLQILNLNLDSNTTLTDLDLTECRKMEDIGPLAEMLLKNKTLKKLAIGPFTRNFNVKMFETFIATNTILTDLVLRSDHYVYNDAVISLANGLAVNKSLRRLTLRTNHINFKIFMHLIDALKQNKSLLEFHTTSLSAIYLDQRPTDGPSISTIIMDLLATNKTLRFITGSEEYSLIDQQLKSNREVQDKIISDTCTLIKMIVIKPHSFILPIEIWLKIFSYVSYDCTPFNFEQFFSKYVA